MLRHLLASAIICGASAAGAVTVDWLDGQPDFTGYASASLTAANFQAVPTARCGTGLSVVNDGCSFAYKTQADGRPFGRGSASPTGWWDNQDLDAWDFSLASSGPFILHIEDAMDRPCTAAFGCPKLVIEHGGVAWSYGFGERLENGNDLYVAIGDYTAGDVLRFRTRANDGLSIAGSVLLGVPPAPVPLPAGGALLLAALAALGAFGRRFRALAP